MNEEEIMGSIIEVLRNEYGEDIYITDTYSNSYPKFPAVRFYMYDSQTHSRGSSFERIETSENEYYEAEIYSNLEGNDKTQQCKDIANLINEVMTDLNFRRTYNQPIANMDSTIARRTCRWQGLV
jgi:hypothetical protein